MGFLARAARSPSRGRRWLIAGAVAVAVSATTAAPAFSADGPPAPPHVRPAQRVSVPATTTGPSDFIMGEGWGCASLPFRGELHWQCWDVGPRPIAWDVPWLAKRRLLAGRDRVCAFDDQALRCWQRPIRGQPGHELSDTAWLGDRAGSAALGGGFACLRTSKGGLFCVGDDRFGQRGGSAVPGPDAGGRDPAFVRGTWPAEAVAAGTWHACALALPGKVGSGYAACWGRDDAGQLGAPATSTCAAGGQQVPCARVPVRGPSIGTEDGVATLAAGDLFTCLGAKDGIRCWGASRDGFFGAPDACPDLMRRAWPTTSGSVAAPRAACAPTAAKLSGASAYPSWLAAGPRGLCFDEGGGARCLGAVPTPRAQAVANPRPSPGDDAAACATAGGGVVCWGQGYAGAGALDQPVAVAFATAVPAAEAAELDLPGFEAPGQSRARLPCQRVVAPLPACAPGIAAGARAWSELPPSAPTLVGQLIHVRGALSASELGEVLTSNPPWVSAWLVLAGPKPLVLAGHGCGGYGGRLCCDLPAYGQTVVATGRLEPLQAGGAAAPWVLASPVLCEEAPRSR